MKTKLKLILAICEGGMKRCRPLLGKIKLPRGFLLRAAVVLLGLVLTTSLAVGIAIYAKGSRGKFVEFWSRGIPYPAGVVRWKIISYSDYILDLAALEHFYMRQQEVAGLPAPPAGVLEKAVMDRMVRNIAIRRLARENNISVSYGELKDELARTITQVGTEEEAELMLRDLYGWDKNTFIDRVLFYFVLEEKLLSRYGSNLELDAAIVKEIDKMSAIRFFGK